VLRIAIVGLGPWGVCTLERVVTRARQGLRSGLELQVHVVEPATPGSGVYDVTQPDYLVLNNPCGQLSLYPFATEDDQPAYGLGLYEWARAQGYGWVGERCVRDPAARPVETHDYLPRRLMGEYLRWFYSALVEAAPPGVQIVHHRAAAVDLIARADGTELVCLDNGEWLLVEHVIVTSGHTANEDHAEVVPLQRQLSPYPVTRYADKLPDGLTVGVSGMGLVAVDVVTALTVGRGGQYADDGNRLRYQPSGREPKLVLFSRSGLPFTAKSVAGVDRTGEYQPAICTPAALGALTVGANGARRQVDVRAELLPVMFAEMHVRYYAQMALQSGSAADAEAVRERLRAAWECGRFDEELSRLAGSFGKFDPAELFFGPELKLSASDEYQQAMYRMLADDLREAQVPGGASPVKSASEVFRIFRDPMRSVVEQGGLSLESYLDFNADIFSRIKRLVAGPPALRSQQFLALMDAGIVTTPFGPAPALGPGRRRGPDLGGLVEVVPGGGQGPATIRLSSTLLGRSSAGEVDLVIRGHLEEPRIDGSASMLLTRLHEEGRISQFRYGSVTVGSVDLTPESHPIDVLGRVQERIWMFGVLTEGIRHFTHYIPSPKSRIRAFEDIGACVSEILG
jgi:FAD-NAD(P)-binding